MSKSELRLKGGEKNKNLNSRITHVGEREREREEQVAHEIYPKNDKVNWRLERGLEEREKKLTKHETTGGIFKREPDESHETRNNEINKLKRMKHKITFVVHSLQICLWGLITQVNCFSIHFSCVSMKRERGQVMKRMKEKREEECEIWVRLATTDIQEARLDIVLIYLNK